MLDDVALSQDPLLAGRARIVALADLYGPLLTPRQRLLLELYHGMDLSLAEIAQREGVSRQAVHDGLRRAAAALEGYEVALGLWARDQARQRDLARLLDELAHLAGGPPAGRTGRVAALARRLAKH